MFSFAFPKRSKMLIAFSFLQVCAFAHELPMKFFDPNKRNDLSKISGKISNEVYYSLGGAFSCKAYHFDQGEYILQDVLTERYNMVGFYDRESNSSMTAQAHFYPSRRNEERTKENLGEAFTCFGVSILEEVDKAEGLKILSEEMIQGETFYALVYVNSLLFPENSERTLPFVYGYLVFKDGDKTMILVDRKKILDGSENSARALKEAIKEELLAFKSSMKLGPVPDLCLERIKEIDNPKEAPITYFTKNDFLLYDLKKKKEAQTMVGR